ncbi:MAG: hypothetical protein V3573_01920 [Desulfovibrionaceae bacterium]
MAMDSKRRIKSVDVNCRPPEPQLLDTCVLQNLDWIDRQLEMKGQIVWDDAALLSLSTRYGVDTANDLVDLGILYKEFEVLGYYPWLTCKTNFIEVSATRRECAATVNDMLCFFKGHQEDLSAQTYSGVALGLLDEVESARVSPLLLRGLGVKSVSDVFLCDGPLSFLPDAGDRQIAGSAVLANVPVILTTDRKTFWKHRKTLSDFGVQVMRPTELLNLYEPYWEALFDEFDLQANKMF